MDVRDRAADQLTALLLAGPWTLQDIGAAIGTVLRPLTPRRRAALTVGVFALGEDRYPPAPRQLRAFLRESADFRIGKDPPVATVLAAPYFAPLAAFTALPLPALATLGELAGWLDLTPEQLDWLAGLKAAHDGTGAPKLQNYHYEIIRKPSGGARLLEAPKALLKATQRRILREILAYVPVHDAAHGFVAGRSCLSGAQRHASEQVVAAFDLAQFFPAIGRPRVHGIFRSLGYPWAVARALAGLCTTTTPRAILRRWPDDAVAQVDVAAIYGVPHLPQGAPTSPALANLLAWRLDTRLGGLASAAGAQYTRYADDLTFSGDAVFRRGLGPFTRAVRTIVAEEGFRLNPAKTRIMPRSNRQVVTGLVVNDHINTARAEFDRLKAVLHHCRRTGPTSQNRSGHADFRRHLDGRVSWVEHVNPARGARLRAAFDAIDWT